jgi:3-methyladenine DNA glycosylase AlkD
MPAKPKKPRAKAASPSPPTAPLPQRLASALAWLERAGTKKVRDGMARYGIVAPQSYGVPMSTLQRLARQLGTDRELAAALWASGWYEARMVATMIDDPARVTPAQMERWCRDFDNWAVCDTACFNLFNATPHALAQVEAWAHRRPEFQRRAAFALLACTALRNRELGDAPYLRCLPLIEAAATDERNFVKKGVNWALRALGNRSPQLHAAALALAERLATSEDATARWVGRDAARQLRSPATLRRAQRAR